VRGKQGKRSRWLLRAAIATVGLAGAVYAADQAATPQTDDLTKIIQEQRIAEGRAAKPGELSEHQVTSFTPPQMVELAGRYGDEMRTAVARAENLRIAAYRGRDLIRMTCIDEKLAQIAIVLSKSEPKLQALATVGPDELIMRQNFLVLQQARERVAELTAEMEKCSGDNLVNVPAGRVKEEVQTEMNPNVYDPTRPPTPVRDIERPSEASPYR
jgi:hypothetical protein